MWRTPVLAVTDQIFPGLGYHDCKKECYDTGSPTKSNLPLQMALYFNVWLFPIWFLVTLICLDAKYYHLTDVYKFLTVALFVILTVLEGIRLYLGYLGNLTEKIPELASFWLLSTLIQFPLELFLLLDVKMMSQLTETIINTAMILLLFIQIITSTFALKTFAHHHAKRFYIAQLYGLEE